MMLMSEYDDAHEDAVLMVKMQANTRSVTALPPYKNLIPRFERCTIFHRRGKLLVNNLPFPKWHPLHFDGSIHPIKFDHSPSGNSFLDIKNLFGFFFIG